MVRKKFLVKGMAALAVGLTLAGCSGEDLFTQADAVKNAKEVLGISIDENRDWNMTAQVSATIAVQGDYGVNYELIIYANDPFVDNKGTVLARSSALSGSTATFAFTVPKGTSAVFVCLRDAKGYNYLKPVGIYDGKLETSFGGEATASSPGFFTRGDVTRSTEADDFVIPDADVPFTSDDITAYLAKAKEPNAENIADNNDGSYWVDGTEGHWVIDTPYSHTDATFPGFGWQGDAGNCLYGWNPVSEETKAWFDANCRAFAETAVPYNGTDAEKNHYIDMFWDVYHKLENTGRTGWINVWTWPVYAETVEEVKHWEDGTDGHWVYDESYVLDFKITGTYNGSIGVLSSEDVPRWENNTLVGYTRAHRDVYITGTWTLPSGEQRVGGNANVVVCSGGTLNIPAGAEMNFVNQARLVVMPGGTLTGAGKINITNGTSEDGYGYNGGTISIATFTNNFGTFFNYGNLLIQNMEGASAYSLYINHGKTLVQSATKGSNTANLRVYNNCWFECTSGFACRNIVQGTGAYFKAGNLEMSASEDNTGDHAYIYAKANSLIDVPGAVALNNVDIIGPYSGNDYAYLQFGYVEGANGSHGLSTATNYTTSWGSAGEYMSAGAVQNNIRVSVDYPEIDTNPNNDTPYEKLRNMLNGTNAFFVEEINPTLDQWNQKQEFPVQGNGNAVIIRKNQYTGIATEASECAPAIEIIDPIVIEEENLVWSYAFEDSYHADYDMNDVVLYVRENASDASKLDVTLCCTGASYNLKVYLGSSDRAIFGDTEVHSLLGAPAGKYVNTETADGDKFVDGTPYTTTIDKPADFTFGTADFWIRSPEGDIHVATAGQDPHGIIIPGEWKWPREYISVREAYPQFSYYYIDGSVNPEYENWYDNPDQTKIYQ